jgi:integrase
MKLPHVHTKRAKGRTYFYFDTGAKSESGGKVLKRLPDIRDPTFARAYQQAQALRTRRVTVEGERTFDWLLRMFERSVEFRALAKNSQTNYSRHLGYASANFRSDEGRSWPLDLLTAEHVLILRDKFAGTPGKANATVRALGALFKWASKAGRKYMAVNPAAGIELLEGGEHEPWPEHLVEAALADPAMRLPVGLLYYTGQRISDVVKMGRSSIARGILTLTQQKTGITLRIAVHSELAVILAADAPTGAMLFLVNEWGKPLTESGVRQRIQKWAKDRGHHVVPHGLRKNAVNALLEAGCSTAEVSAITGQDLQTIEHYAKQRDKEHLSRAAILKFERRNKSRRKSERENRG